MAQRYDVSLKSLFLQQGDGIIRRLLFGSKVVEYLSTEQPQIFNHRADMVVRTEDGALHHVELQVDNEVGFAVRMLCYYAYLIRAYRQHVVQVVLYIGREPLRMEPSYFSPSIDFRFSIVNVRELDPAPLLASEDWADNALALLAKGDPMRALEAVIPRLRALQAADRHAAASTLVLLSGIIGIAKRVNERLEEVGMINVMENEVIGPMLLERLEKGREEGQRSLIQEQLMEKFGTLPQWATHRVETASTEQCSAWAKRILRSESLEDTLG